jgi:MGT family glycosyltransferase
LPPDPDLTMPSANLVVSPFPPSFRDPAWPLPANAISIRPGPGADDDAPPRHRPPSGPPVVYLTLGTVFNAESGDLFERALAGLRALPIEVVATVGRDLDPERFGAQPGRVRIERFIPQADLLPGCDLVVSHGGSGTISGALAHGLPQVVMPMGADQALNAAHCDRLGVGVTLDAEKATPGTIADAVAHVLASRSYRVAAERIRDEVAALPGPEAVVPLIEGSVSSAD